MSALDIPRSFPILGILTIMAIFIIVLGSKVSRKAKYPNQKFLAGGYYLYFLGAVLNILYYILCNILGILRSEAIILFFMALGISCLFLAQVFIIIFQHSIRNLNFKINHHIYAAITFICLIIPINLVLVYNFTRYNASTHWAPYFMIEFALYYAFMLLVLILIEIREAYKIYQLLKATDQGLIKAISWKWFNIGILGIPSLFIILAFSNLSLDPIIRTIAGVLFILLIPFALILYKSLSGKKNKHH